MTTEAWSVPDATRTAESALAAIGRPLGPLTLLRLGENAIFRHSLAAVLVRVARPTTPVADVARTMQLAAILHGMAVRVGAPALDWANEPVVTQNGPVSIWRYYQPVSGTTLDFHTFGATLRAIHQLQPPVAVPIWDPLASVARRLRTFETEGRIPEAWIDHLRSLAAAVRAGLEAMPTRGTRLLHADAHSGNVLTAADGLVLVDLDNMSTGPLEADFIPTLVQARRFKTPRSRYQALLKGYGYVDEIGLEHSPLVQVRELTMVSWLLQQYGLDSEKDAEMGKRVASLTDDLGGEAHQWFPH